MEVIGRPLQFTFDIDKVDEEKRQVWGWATTETLDKQNDVVDYEASKKAFTEWFPIGNIREQHDAKKAVGVAVAVQPDDETRRVYVGSYISRSADGENTWTKVRERVLKGYSIKGIVTDSHPEMVKDGDREITAQRITGYRLDELSLVDNPANPEATLAIWKSTDGTGEVEGEALTGETRVEKHSWTAMDIRAANDLINKLNELFTGESFDHGTDSPRAENLKDAIDSLTKYVRKQEDHLRESLPMAEDVPQDQTDVTPMVAATAVELAAGTEPGGVEKAGNGFVVEGPGADQLSQQNQKPAAGSDPVSQLISLIQDLISRLTGDAPSGSGASDDDSDGQKKGKKDSDEDEGDKGEDQPNANGDNNAGSNDDAGQETYGSGSSINADGQAEDDMDKATTVALVEELFPGQLEKAVGGEPFAKALESAVEKAMGAAEGRIAEKVTALLAEKADKPLADLTKRMEAIEAQPAVDPGAPVLRVVDKGLGDPVEAAKAASGGLSAADKDLLEKALKVSQGSTKQSIGYALALDEIRADFRGR